MSQAPRRGEPEKALQGDPMVEQKEFRPTFKKFYSLLVPAMVIALALMWFGYRYYDLNQRILESARKAGGQMPDDFPPSWLFYVLPWFLAAVIVLCYLWIYALQRGRYFVVTPLHLEVRRGDDIKRTLWQNVSYTPPRNDKKRFRSFLLSDGSYYERIDDFFYPEFNLFTKFVSAAKQNARENITT